MGGCWVPRGVDALDYKVVPLLYTALLLGSGMLVTWAHYGIIIGWRVVGLRALGSGVALGLLCTCFVCYHSFRIKTIMRCNKKLIISSLIFCFRNEIL